MSTGLVTWDLRVGDVREQLREIPDQTVQTCVTSPPYWGLRDYGTASWEGGDPACDHNPPDDAGQTNKPTRGQREHAGRFAGSHCFRCGARRIDSQIGLEPTPDDFCAALVDVFREVRRVLKDDGTCWVNLGDTYLAQQGAGFNGQKRLDHANRNVKVKRPHGVKPKDLCGIPWMVAFALRSDGWYLRSDIVWAKPNPMPESVTDRPTKAHEMIFLLSKSPRYFYDADAIREGISETGVIASPHSERDGFVFRQDFGLEHAGASYAAVGIRLAAAVLDLSEREDQRGLSLLDSQIGHEGSDSDACLTVVHVPIVRRAATEAARFSNGDISAKEFLEEMHRLCVALPDGDDLKEAWRLAALNVGHVNADGDRSIAVHDTSKISKIEGIHQGDSIARVPSSHMKNTPRNDGERWRLVDGGVAARGTRNCRSVWTITTQPYPEAHFATFPEAIPERCIKAGSKLGDTVLDPFTGSGTTGRVALRLGRHFLGVELNPQYAELARQRMASAAPLFTEASA